jgi:hypothetical protein
LAVTVVRVEKERNAAMRNEYETPTRKERTMQKRFRNPFALVALTLTGLVVTVAAKDVPAELPKPDGTPADMTKPVQVYILLGQSNMVGAGKITGDKEGSLTCAVQEKNKYPYLVDDEGNWTVRKDVRYARVM